jgi:hypothetical protein
MKFRVLSSEVQNWTLRTNTNALNLFTPPHPSPSRGEGEGGGDVILFNAFVLITPNLLFH